MLYSCLLFIFSALSHFFDVADRRNDWNRFVTWAFQSIAIAELQVDDAVLCIQHHVRTLAHEEKAPATEPPLVFVGVDELVKCCPEGSSADVVEQRVMRLLSALGAVLDSSIPFDCIVTTIDFLSVIPYEISSHREVHWLQLRPIAPEDVAAQMFPRSTPLFDTTAVQRCASDCNGHPRSLELLWALLLPYTDNAPPRNYLVLINRLVDKIQQRYLHVTLLMVAPALLADVVSLCEVPDPQYPSMTFNRLLADGVYLNSVTIGGFVPRLSPLVLRAFVWHSRQRRKPSPSSQIRHNLAQILEAMLDMECNFHPELLESWHANWEVMRALLLGDDVDVDLQQQYCRTGATYSRSWDPSRVQYRSNTMHVRELDAHTDSALTGARDNVSNDGDDDYTRQRTDAKAQAAKKAESPAAANSNGSLCCVCLLGCCLVVAVAAEDEAAEDKDGESVGEERNSRSRAGKSKSRSTLKKINKRSKAAPPPPPPAPELEPEPQPKAELTRGRGSLPSLTALALGNGAGGPPSSPLAGSLLTPTPVAAWPRVNGNDAFPLQEVVAAAAAEADAEAPAAVSTKPKRKRSGLFVVVLSVPSRLSTFVVV